jgi:hypothetical protein
VLNRFMQYRGADIAWGERMIQQSDRYNPHSVRQGSCHSPVTPMSDTAATSSTGWHALLPLLGRCSMTAVAITKGVLR